MRAALGRLVGRALAAVEAPPARVVCVVREVCWLVLREVYWLVLRMVWILL